MMKQDRSTIHEVFSNNVNDEQLNRLIEFYKTKGQLFSKHKRDFKYFFEDTSHMMKAVNELMPKYKEVPAGNAGYQLTVVNLLDDEYIMVKRGWVVAFFHKISGACHVYHNSEWKSTNVLLWSSSHVGYGANSNPSNSFYTFYYKPVDEDLELIYSFPEFKYIDLTKLEYVNLYTLFNNRFQKEHLWQIEMLIKSGHIRLATEIAASYTNIDFKVFRQYQDFFKLRGRGLWHYHKIENLRKDGFENPEFIYLDTYESYYNQFWLRFLKEHPEVNRRKFINYIKGRKTTKTIFGEIFLDVYKLYLGYIMKLDLDLSRDKYMFPDDLISEFKEILLVMNHNWRNTDYMRCLLQWQSQLPIEEMNIQYAEEAINLRNRLIKEKRDREIEKEKIRKAKEEMKRTLEIIWQTNKMFNFEISDEFILTAPKSPDDLYVEGKTLNHCVYGYLDRIARKETAVLFIRKKKYPDKPFYTVEVNNGKVIQCRSTNNLDPGNVASFFSEWINQNITTIKNKTAMAIN